MGELPDERGRFGAFGGRYVPETLIAALQRLEEIFHGHTMFPMHNNHLV